MKNSENGMQTRVWGPGGWLFLHCIAQNYPLEPSPEKKTEYLNFFKLVGSVLPCRYCRESYHEFITQPGTILDNSVMGSRKSLSLWLYKIHNKVNKKLGITGAPTFKEVWEKYESFRSKCTKSIEPIKVVKKGCTDPLNGYRKKCFMDIKNVDEHGNPIRNISFGSKNKKIKKIKLISIKKSSKSGKKLTATFEINGKKRIIHFGASGMSDYTKHKDKDRRKRYINRHLKDLGTKNPMRAGFLSMFVLWNKTNIQAGIRDYKRRLNVYNNTGKFPTKII